MKVVLFVVVFLWVLGCGKKEPVQPSASNPGAPKPEPTKAKVAVGDKLWEFETGAAVSSSPAIGSGGTVYVGSLDKKLYAINGKTGVKLWEFDAGGTVRSSPAIGSDGTVYFVSGGKKLYAIKTDSKGPAKSPWPMHGQNARHTGRVMKK